MVQKRSVFINGIILCSLFLKICYQSTEIVNLNFHCPLHNCIEWKFTNYGKALWVFVRVLYVEYRYFWWEARSAVVIFTPFLSVFREKDKYPCLHFLLIRLPNSFQQIHL